MIRADLTLVPDPIADLDKADPPPGLRHARPAQKSADALIRQPFPSLAAAPVPAWARASGRADGDPLFFAGASLALLDAFLRRDPPAAGALRSRLALQSAAASAKILRLNAGEGALRDLRFAIGDAGLPASTPAVSRRRPPALDLALLDPNGLASSLRACAGEGDPVSAAAKAAAFVFSVFPDAPAAEAEVLALWVFDLALAIRLRWARPLPLIATKILDPGLRSDAGGRRARPNEAAWSRTAAGAIALAAVFALDLATHLSRRSETLLAVAHKLRAKPAAKIVELVLAEDCVSPAEAARQAPMTGRAARRLFDRLVHLSAARELTGRPAFRLYGL